MTFLNNLSGWAKHNNNYATIYIVCKSLMQRDKIRNRILPNFILLREVVCTHCFSNHLRIL